LPYLKKVSLSTSRPSCKHCLKQLLKPRRSSSRRTMARTTRRSMATRAPSMSPAARTTPRGSRMNSSPQQQGWGGPKSRMYRTWRV
jgi:hypothetical protein